MDAIAPLQTIERDYVLRVLNQLAGNRTHTAKALGISIRTLRNKLNQYRSQGVAVPIGKGMNGIRSHLYYANQAPMISK